jgi:hypothetical protein
MFDIQGSACSIIRVQHVRYSGFSMFDNQGSVCSGFRVQHVRYSGFSIFRVRGVGFRVNRTGIGLISQSFLVEACDNFLGMRPPSTHPEGHFGNKLGSSSSNSASACASNSPAPIVVNVFTDNASSPCGLAPVSTSHATKASLYSPNLSLMSLVTTPSLPLEGSQNPARR